MAEWSVFRFPTIIRAYATPIYEVQLNDFRLWQTSIACRPPVSRARLTSPDERLRTQWRLPSLFDPLRTSDPLSYHSDGERWHATDTHMRLSTVGRGQEFVLDADVYPEALAWFNEML